MKKQSVLSVMLALALVFSLSSSCDDGTVNNDPTGNGNNGVNSTGHVTSSQNVTNSDVGTALNVTQPRFILADKQTMLGGCKVLGCRADYYLLKSPENGLINPDYTPVEMEMYNEAFFVENNLVLIALKNSNSGDSLELGSIGVKDDILNIVINWYQGDAMDSFTSLLFIPIKKADYDGVMLDVRFAINPSPNLGDPSLPGPPQTIGEGSGWPTAKLPSFTLGGWNVPSGISGISWEELMSGTEYHFLRITFPAATAETKNSIHNYLTGTWAATPNVIQDDPNDFEATYVKVVDGKHYGVITKYTTAEGGYINLSRSPEPNPLQ